jgi:divalent metal cation (Fe/Co/Zn/Cd) transporter
VVAQEAATVRAVVREVTGSEPRRLRFREDADGLVALLTVALPEQQTIDAAHRVATDLERRIRDAAPTIAAVIVHTEPR